MNISKQIQAFSTLGAFLEYSTHNPDTEFTEILQKAYYQNPWFTQENCIMACKNIAQMLQKDSLEAWLASYSWTHTSPKKIAVIMAGNIPFVGFHDALCVLISGNILIAKLSSKDRILPEYIFSKLCEIEPDFTNNIQICEHTLPQFDAIICTGSNNSSRYFEYYFGTYPHIIRKNRTSVAVLLDSDDEHIAKLLAQDIFSYFGLGCRNVSKIYIPQEYDITKLLDAFGENSDILKHNKYMNNYEYQKSIFLLCKQAHFDNGYLLVTEDTNLHSPLAVLFYERYTSAQDVQEKIHTYTHELQCLVCSQDIFSITNTLPGTSQFPRVSDYADSIDTLSFILNI